MTTKKYVATVSYLFSGNNYCQLHSMDWVGFFEWKWVAWLVAWFVSLDHSECRAVITILPLVTSERLVLRRSDRILREEKWECTRCESVYFLNHYRGWRWVWSKSPCKECRKMYFTECDPKYLDASLRYHHDDNSPPCSVCGATSLQSCDAGLHS